MVIGVVENVKQTGLTGPTEPEMYLPYWRQPSGEVTFLVQTSTDAAAFAPLVKQTLKGVDPHLDPRRLVTMRDYMAYSSSSFRATAALAGALGVVGLLLTILGVYGVVAYRTSWRTREIGIRMALGAQRREVLALVVREGSLIALAGVAIGIPAALAATRALASMLFQVSAWDPLSFSVAAVLVFALACVATMIPALRATRIAPSRALRDS